MSLASLSLLLLCGPTEEGLTKKWRRGEESERGGEESRGEERRERMERREGCLSRPLRWFACPVFFLNKVLLPTKMHIQDCFTADHTSSEPRRENVKFQGIRQMNMLTTDSTGI